MPHHCISCRKSDTARQEALQCETCLLWNHRVCGTGITRVHYCQLVRGEEDLQWYCNHCQPLEEDVPVAQSPIQEAPPPVVDEPDNDPPVVDDEPDNYPPAVDDEPDNDLPAVDDEPDNYPPAVDDEPDNDPPDVDDEPDNDHQAPVLLPQQVLEDSIDDRTIVDDDMEVDDDQPTFSVMDQASQRGRPLLSDTRGYIFTVRVLQHLLALLPGRPAVRKVIMDFEMAMWKAVQHHLPRVELRGCSFHWTQAVRLPKDADSCTTGWHGLTALHKACLIGDWTICFLLLEAGSNPNAENDSKETPMHYACKRGIAPVMHLLIQRKGDPMALDQNGMAGIHHCATLGNVYSFIYLESQGVSMRELDKQLRSPLHHVCQYGHIDAFKFLMRKERSKLDQADSDGNTPFHVAAMEGQSHLCWLILYQDGCSGLHVRNRDGYTPVDLVFQRDKIGHKLIKPVLQYYSKKDKHHMPSGPVWFWYWLLVMPGVVYGGLVMLAVLFSLSYQGLIIMAGMAMFVYLLSRNSHRIDHPCRWPNPVFAGTFAAGLLHTIILYIVQIQPYIHFNMFLNGIIYVLLVVLLYFYYKVLHTEPGVVKQSVNDKSTGRPLTIVDLCVPHRKIEMLCFTCEIIRGTRTKHCKLCDKCYHLMDHHCLFLLKCVAKNNHSQFIWFIIYVLFCMFIFLAAVVKYCCNLYPDMGMGELLTTMFAADGWVVSMVIMHLGSIFWALNLLRFQFKLISNAHTTVFKTNEESVLTANEKLLNVVYFLMGREPFMEDPMVGQYV